MFSQTGEPTSPLSARWKQDEGRRRALRQPSPTLRESLQAIQRTKLWDIGCSTIVVPLQLHLPGVKLQNAQQHTAPTGWRTRSKGPHPEPAQPKFSLGQFSDQAKYSFDDVTGTGVAVFCLRASVRTPESSIETTASNNKRLITCSGYNSAPQKCIINLQLTSEAVESNSLAAHTQDEETLIKTR